MNSLRFFRFIAISCLLATVAVSLCADTLSHTWAPEKWQLAWEQSFSYGQIALSPDGTLLAVPYINGEIVLFRTSDHTRVRSLWGGNRYPHLIRQLVFSPDGKLLAEATTQYSAQVWNVANGEMVAVLGGDEVGVTSVAFSPDGRWFAIATKAEVWLYSITQTPHIYMDLVRRYTGHTHDVTYVTFSPDSTQIASGGTEVQLWRVADGQLAWAIKDFDSLISCLAFSPDGSRLVIGTQSSWASVWHSADGTLIKNLSEGNRRMVASITFSPHGEWLLVTCGGDAQLWRTADLTLVRTVEVLSLEKIGHYRDFMCVAAFMPDGKTLVTGSPANAVQFWQVADGTLTSTLTIQTGFSNLMTFSPDNAWLAVADPDDGGIQLWHLPDRAAPQAFPDGRVWTFAFSPDGQWFASGGSTIRIRRVADWRIAYEFNVAEHGLELLAFSADSKTVNAVACLNDNYTFARWDLRTGKLASEKREKISDARPIAISADGTTVVVFNGRDHAIDIYNLLDGMRVQRLPFPDECQNRSLFLTNTDVALSADGHWLAIGMDPYLNIWQLPAGKLVSKLKSHGGHIMLNISPDGQWLVTDGSWRPADISVDFHIWRMADGTHVTTMDPANIGLDRIQFSPDGRWLACLGHGGLSVFQTGESTMMNNEK